MKDDRKVVVMGKNILLLGNGFDLANRLPTTYRDFLEFCEKISVIYTEDNLDNYEKHIKDWRFNESIKEDIIDAFESREFGKTEVRTNNQYLDELFGCIHKNLWYYHFQHTLKRRTNIGDNWIDFESEISYRVIQIDSKDVSSENKMFSNILILYTNMFEKELTDLNKPQEFKAFVSILYDDLNKFTRALEIYLSAFVSHVKVKKVRDFNGKMFDYILSFNYTSTFERHYKSKMAKGAELCYLHGKAKRSSTIETCNLVLGIDEYLTGEEKNTQSYYLPFKKFYQRIIKGTENNYSKWLDEIHNSSEDVFELHIFGHSLDETDKDILKKFILNDNVHTKIYYYRKHENDKADFGNKIKNLINIMGPDELIRRTSGGLSNTIEFIPQII